MPPEGVAFVRSYQKGLRSYDKAREEEERNDEIEKMKNTLQIHCRLPASPGEFQSSEVGNIEQEESLSAGSRISRQPSLQKIPHKSNIPDINPYSDGTAGAQAWDCGVVITPG
ncbi:hypothetical protein Baya_0405 [Bagarius yarrelli]|uniref:Uncharacterized protein n=1 Tax=Bagarius yarrelli TaxID=175774 RepID=A0A556TI57_BAGYA|nr:hypothetical protein Baya_0405 [Bagarius yarrelli]